MNHGGILLVGGAGRRIGGDKPWQLFAGIPLYRHALATLAQVAEPIYLVGIGEDERPRYRELPQSAVMLDDPRLGPLSGLRAGLQASIHEWNQLLPVDMPLLSAAVLTGLGQFCSSEISAVIPVCQGRVQPLCGLYQRRLVTGLGAQLDNGRLRVMSWLDSLGSMCLRIEIRAELANQFRNLNTVQEISDALPTDDL